MLKIWGREDSFNLQKAIWCVAELGIPFERIDAGGAFGVTDQPFYRAMNPNRRVPTIDDDGFVLWESNAIIRYLSAKYAMGSLCPGDPLARADADRWMSWQGETVGPNMRLLNIQLVRTAPADRDPAAIAAIVAAAIEHWTILDDHLAGRDYVLGGDFTMADIPVGTHADRWLTYEVERPALPHLEAWYGRLCERPAFRTHAMTPPAGPAG